MYLLALKIALIAYVYSVILTEQGMLLNGLYRWLDSKNLPDWLFNPLIGCSKCVTGQMALWYLILEYLKMPYLNNIVEIVFFLSLAIFISYVINKIYIWLN